MREHFLKPHLRLGLIDPLARGGFHAERSPLMSLRERWVSHRAAEGKAVRRTRLRGRGAIRRGPQAVPAKRCGSDADRCKQEHDKCPANL